MRLQITSNSTTVQILVQVLELMGRRLEQTLRPFSQILCSLLLRPNGHRRRRMSECGDIVHDEECLFVWHKNKVTT